MSCRRELRFPTISEFCRDSEIAPTEMCLFNFNVYHSLIRATLEGDQNAFTVLVKRYQKQVHALVWRKIGDFHIAEEITQDIFLKVYKKLMSLKPPYHFSGWLYVVATRHSIAWIRKNKHPITPLSNISKVEIEEHCYLQYEVEQSEANTVEHQRGIVKQLLKKLPESERTVVILHYLAEMPCEKISEFMGVSKNTIKSRLHRARKRLEKQEHLLNDVSEIFQLQPTLTQNIMREIERIKPSYPSVSKPWIPWGLSFASVLFVIMMMGMGPHVVSRFQQPYTLHADSDMTIELVDSPVVHELERKSDAQSRFGQSGLSGRNSGTGVHVDSPLVAAADVEQVDLSPAKPKWIQTKGPGGVISAKLYLASDQSLYAITKTGLYILTEEADGWIHVSSSGPNQEFDGVMAKRDDTLYLLTSNELISSTDDGKTWNNLGARPEGFAVALLTTDTAMYLVLKTDVFRLRFEDVGNAWELVGDTLRDIRGDVPEVVNPKIRPNSVDAENPNFRPIVGPLDVLALHNLAFRIWDAQIIDNTLFIGTSQGLFRFTDDWEKLQMSTSQGIKSLAVNEKSLYVGTMAGHPNPREPKLPRAAVFSSTNLGDSWTGITPNTGLHSIGIAEVVTVGDTLILSGTGLRSKDGGKTWIVPVGNQRRFSIFPAIGLGENTLYGLGRGGIKRSTDFGLTWHPFMNGIVNSHVPNLIVVKNVLYAQTPTELLKSADRGESWESADLMGADEKAVPFQIRKEMKFSAANGILYASNSQPDGVTLFRLSDDDVFLPVEGVPDFALGTLHTELEKKFKNESDKVAKQFRTEWEKKREEAIKNNPNVDIDEVMKQFRAEWIEIRTKPSGINIATMRNNPDLEKAIEQRFAITTQNQIAEEQRTNGTFTISDDTVFMEYRHKLFRWRFGETVWHDTGLEDQDASSPIRARKGFTLAVSGKTVYAGKRGGDLFLSVDGGDTWTDVTENLAFPGLFKEIMFADSTVYVSTNMGVMSSSDGETWHVLNGDDGDILIINWIAVEGANVYGVNEIGIYKVNKQTNTWVQIVPKLPYIPASFAIDSDTFYIGTRQNGVLRFHRPEQ